jgi:myo-inositol-1(or 4)-monophosphatase
MLRAVNRARDLSMNESTQFLEFAIGCVRRAGKIVLDHFGKTTPVRVKESQSSVVTAADVAAEQQITSTIRAEFPRHGIIAEESGWHAGEDELVWIVDPLDGTSNFAAGLPWFGVMLVLLRRSEPVVSAMYLPALDTLYTAAAGAGAWRDGTPIRVTTETDLRTLLCAYAFDAATDAEEAGRQAAGLTRVARHVRNIRATNCLLDVCYTADGRLGGCINHSAMIWDVAPVALLLREAGGVLADFTGTALRLDLSPEGVNRNYAFLGASRMLLPSFAAVLAEGAGQTVCPKPAG